MIPLIIAAVAAAAALKKQKDENDQANRDRKLQAEIAKNSPWTGMQANLAGTEQKKGIGDALNAGLLGYQAGMGMSGDGGGNLVGQTDFGISSAGLPNTMKKPGSMWG